MSFSKNLGLPSATFGIASTHIHRMNLHRDDEETHHFR